MQVTEAGTQSTDECDKPDRTRFDLGRALRVLRTGLNGDLKRVLQRLHIRNFHQPAAQLAELLQAAGMSERVLTFVEPVEMDAAYAACGNALDTYQRQQHG